MESGGFLVSSYGAFLKDTRLQMDLRPLVLNNSAAGV